MIVGLLDYGAGNLHSLKKALERFGVSTLVSTEWPEVLATDALILPGVGAFGAAVAALPSDPSTVRARLEEGLPCLGICLGMQLLFESSEEAGGSGIGLIPGTVRRLEANTVPHIGWNDVERVDDPRADVLGQASEPLVAYFANSFVCHPENPSCVLAWSSVDTVRFPSAVQVGRTLGVQFHPEKSSNTGLDLIGRFLEEASS